MSPRGLRLICSARNKSVFRGAVLPLTVFLPMLGTFDAKVVAGAVGAVQGGDRYSFEATWVGDARPFLEALTRYLILTGAGGTLSRLVALGLPVRDVEPLIHFRVASGAAETAIAQAFRASLQKGASAASSLVEIDAPEGALAENGQQVFCFLGGELLGVGRVHFVKGKGKAASALERRLCRLPTGLQEAGFVECSWLCAKANVHTPDAFAHFVKQFARLAMESGIPRLVTTCRRDAWPVYNALGFVSVPVEFLPGVKGTEDAVVAMLDVAGVLRGSVPVDKKIWSRIFEPVAAHIGLYGTMNYGKGSKQKFSKPRAS